VSFDKVCLQQEFNLLVNFFLKKRQMKKSILTKIAIVAGLLLLGITNYGQIPSWGGSSPSSTMNYYDIVSQTQAHFDSTGLDTVPHSGYKDFKRWEYSFKNLSNSNSTSISDPGGFSTANTAMATLFNDQSLICNGNSLFPNAWEPSGYDYNDNGGSYGKMGMATCVYVDEKNDLSLNTVYVGTSSGGLWKTTTAKSTNPSWVCLSDNVKIPVLGVSSIAVSKKTSSTDKPHIYISTGVWRHTNNPFSMGVIRSLDDGITWSATGLSYDVNNPIDYQTTQKVVLAPWKENGKDALFVLKQNELYYSADEGTNFDLTFSLPDNVAIGGYKSDGSPRTGVAQIFRDIIFVNNNKILLSTDDISGVDPNGSSGETVNGGSQVWSATKDLIQNNGSGTTGELNITTSVFGTINSKITRRIDLDFYANDKDIIYVLAANVDFDNVISKSIDGGSGWSPYITNFKTDSKRNDLKVSANNPNTIFAGGVYLKKSPNSFRLALAL